MTIGKFMERCEGIISRYWCFLIQVHQISPEYLLTTQLQIGNEWTGLENYYYIFGVFQISLSSFTITLIAEQKLCDKTTPATLTNIFWFILIMLCLIEMSREGNNNHLVVGSVPKH